MAGYFQHDCPHCYTKAVAFAVRYEIMVRAGTIWHVFGQCERCALCISAVFKGPQGQKPSLDPKPFKILEIFPEVRSPDLPDHMPDHVAGFYQQGVDSLTGNYDAAGAMFRKALDTGTKAAFPEFAGNTLFNRIENAVGANKLTPELGEWAHVIRMEGNDATHDEDPYTRPEAESLHAFTEILMQYMFTLPGMLAERRREAEGDEE